MIMIISDYYLNYFLSKEDIEYQRQKRKISSIFHKIFCRDKFI